MTTLDLEPIKERLAAATPGPWRVWRDPDPTNVRATAVETAWCYGDIEGDTELITDYLPTDADARFIAEAPSDIEALIGEVERLRGQIEAVKALHRKFLIYDTLSENCTEHDQDAFGIEADYGDWYCTKHIAYCTCEICFTDYGERIEYPCPTIHALEVGE